MTTQNFDSFPIVRENFLQLEVRNPVSKPNDDSDSENASKNHGKSKEENLYQSPRNISHDLFMHNIDIIAGASSFMNQAFDSAI